MALDILSEMASWQDREKTFKNWPFKKGPCRAREMAKSGFFSSSQKHLLSVKCYYCFKELEGWEPTDIPFEEHKTHASYCCFINMFDKPPEVLTIEQVLQLELGRMVRVLEMEKDARVQKFSDEVNNLVDQLVIKKTTRKRHIKKSS